MKSYLRQHGFTINEIIITLAILAILAAIAFPFMANNIAKARANEVATKIYNGLNRAKSGAISSQMVGKFVPESNCSFEGSLGSARAGNFQYDYPYRVECEVENLTSVYFRPDGSVSQTDNKLSPLNGELIFIVKGGNAKYTVKLDPYGNITKEQS